MEFNFCSLVYIFVINLIGLFIIFNICKIKCNLVFFEIDIKVCIDNIEVRVGVGKML